MKCWEENLGQFLKAYLARKSFILETLITPPGINVLLNNLEITD